MGIIIDEHVMHGEPVIRGTRVPVRIVVGSLAGGMGFEEVEEEYGITREQILECLDYAARILSEEEVHLLGA